MDDTARSIGQTSDAGADVERRTSEIRRDIEHTRGEMSETIEAIEEKLRPGNIVSSAKERVKNAATERVRNMRESAEQAYSRMRSGAGANSGGLMSEIRHNPIPAAMIGIGAAWLLMSRRSNDSDSRRFGWTTYEGRTRGNSYDSMPEGAALTSGFEEEVDYGESADTRVSRYAGNVTNEARDRGRRVQSQFQRIARENPLMVGAGALLLGSAVALAIPETRQEDEWLGDTRDSMLDKAQEMARTTAARAQETAADLAGEAASRIVGGPSE